MNLNSSSASQDPEGSADPRFELHIRRMHQVTIYGRWAVVVFSWILFAPVCLWALKDEFALWKDSFTWAAVRFSLAYNPWATLGLALCLGMTLSTMIWHSRNILWGLPRRDRKRLEQIVCRIQKQGPTHPLWKWIFQQ